MTQEEFIQLSETEVKELNGSVSEDAQEAFRAGYLYAQSIIKNWIDNKYAEDFIESCQEFANEDLEIFNYY